jgi:hypothetical protein
VTSKAYFRYEKDASIVCIEVFTFIISTSACVLDVITRLGLVGPFGDQDLECRMRLERITDGAPRFVVHTQFQFNRDLCFLGGRPRLQGVLGYHPRLTETSCSSF